MAISKTVSQGASFSWMGGGFTHTIDDITTEWLDNTMVDFREFARKFSKKKTGISFLMSKIGAHHSVLTITADKDGPLPLAYWALGEEVQVPVGGFKPRPGLGQFLMLKPEGFVWRKRNYSRHSGELLKRKGFIEEALEATFTKERLDALGVPLASVIGTAVAYKIKAMYLKQGIQAEVH
jgi:hypothetical protein